MTSSNSEEKIQTDKPAPVLYMMEVSAPCRNVMFAAGLAGVQLQWKHIDWANGEHLKADFLKACWLKNFMRNFELIDEIHWGHYVLILTKEEVDSWFLRRAHTRKGLPTSYLDFFQN